MSLIILLRLSSSLLDLLRLGEGIEPFADSPSSKDRAPMLSIKPELTIDLTLVDSGLAPSDFLSPGGLS